MLLFKVLGSWVRGLYLMGIGGFWLSISLYLSRSAAPNPAMLSMTIIGGLVFASGLIVILRGLAMSTQRSPLPKGSAAWRDDGERSASDFDADAAIARYLENRTHVGAEPAPAQAPPEAPQPAAPPRPAFGRKQV